MQYLLTLFYTRGLVIVVIVVIVVLNVMVPQPYNFLFAFSHRFGILTVLEFSSKWVKVMLPYRKGEC